MKLIIAEKPSVAKSIASALGAASRADGFYEGNGLIVSWCVGHLVSPMDAASYDERYKKWRYDDLPILPEPFGRKPSGRRTPALLCGHYPRPETAVYFQGEPAHAV